MSTPREKTKDITMAAIVMQGRETWKIMEGAIGETTRLRNASHAAETWVRHYYVNIFINDIFFYHIKMR